MLRQIGVSLRAMISLLLRGVSFLSVNNSVLVELAASLVGTAFSAMVEGSIRNLTWTFRIVSAYPGASVEAGMVVVDRWDGLDLVAGTTNHVQYILLLRTPPAGIPRRSACRAWGQWRVYFGTSAPTST